MAEGDRLIVTGAGGAVGEALVHQLTQSADAEVVALFSRSATRDAFLSRNVGRPASRVRTEVCDLAQPDQVHDLARGLLGGRRSVVVHAAANVSWTASRADAWAGNVEITRNVADLSRVLDAGLVYVSSAFTSPTKQTYRNTYEESKAAAERLLLEDYADLEPTTFACSLVVGHSVTGEITRYHGIYPMLGLLERYQPPFLPGRPDSRVDVVPVDWVTRELALVAERRLRGVGGGRVVAAAGEQAPSLSELLPVVLETLNRHHEAEGREPLSEPPLIPYRRWDFLRRSMDAWGVTALRVPDQASIDRLISVYRPYLEDVRARQPVGTSCPPPGWRSYITPVIEHWYRRHHASPALQDAT